MKQLDTLSIDNTDIDSGLEHLPPNKLNYFTFSSKEKKAAKVAKIYAVCGNDSEKGMLLSNVVGFDKEKLIKYQVDFQKRQSETLVKSEMPLTTSLEITNPSILPSSKKSKNAKRKEKLNTAQEQINQLQSELETEKVKNASFQKEYSFYKNFFDNHFQDKKTELTELKNSLSKEELEWLDIYCEASQETEKSSFVKKQLKRAKDNLKDKLSEEELKLIVEKQNEINELEKQLNNLQIQETQIEVPPK